MSGHSKWATIKRKKAVTDARRGKIFNQLIREITIAARMGGGDPSANPRLRLVVDKAKANNMPSDNIKRAIQKGTGELPGTTYDEVTYEAYGPSGVALIVETVTDNKTRTVSEIRHLLDRNHGKLASAGAVAYQFTRKGIVTVPANSISEEDLLAIVLDSGAEDLRREDDHYLVSCSPEYFEEARKSLDEKSVLIENAEIRLIPESTVKVEGQDAQHLLRLVEALEDHVDVQQVHSNFEVDDSVLANYSGS
jgi:YebC/PmpR family DNA-binding regulatory protein